MRFATRGISTGKCADCLRISRAGNALRGLQAEEFARQAAHFLAELNAIHPFREGNGRTQLSFFVALAQAASHAPQPRRLRPRAILNAMIRSFGGDERPLAQLIHELVAPREH